LGHSGELCGRSELVAISKTSGRFGRETAVLRLLCLEVR
jgi:hypothetical protein